MDLSSMLNESTSKSNNNSRRDSTIKPNYQQNTSTSKESLYQLGASLQLALAKDNQQQQQLRPLNGLLSSPFRSTEQSSRITAPTTPTPPVNLTNSAVLEPSVCPNPSNWNPTLSFELVMKEHPLMVNPNKRSRLNHNGDTPANINNSLEVQLRTHEIPNRSDNPRVLLEDKYEIQGAYPRGFFVIMAKRSIHHSFVFKYPDHFWFEDLYGLRKSAYVSMRTAEGELYELHLKPSRDKMWLFGYLIKHEDMLRIVKDSLNELLLSRKLPLVLDLDDTLVRLVGDNNDRFVPESDVPKCNDRIATLKDGRRVVLAERVHEFLEWAQNLYDISVCSLGDQNYVENVVLALDPQRTRIRGILYSARSEHDYIKRSPEPGRPPKDLLALYSFCALKDKSLGSAFSLPIILDDETRMWPIEQHDNIIEVKCQSNIPVWSVSLFPTVQDTLAFVHQEFFRQLDAWNNKLHEAEQSGNLFTRIPPSAVNIYKTHLRQLLRDIIANPKPLPTISSTNENPSSPSSSSAFS